MPPTSTSILVENVMTSHVRTAGADERLHEIWQHLVDEQCHHIPVVENGKPVGMISTRDLLRIARKHGAQRVSAGLYGDETAGDVMSTELVTVRVDDPVEVAIDRIGRGDIHALIVLDTEDNLAGIVTNHDLLDYLIS